MLYGVSARLIAIVGVFIVYGGIIWHLHTIFDQAKDDKVARAAAMELQRSQAETERVAAEAREKQLKLEDKITKIKGKWNDKRIANANPDCKLSADALLLLKQSYDAASSPLGNTN